MMVAWLGYGSEDGGEVGYLKCIQNMNICIYMYKEPCERFRVQHKRREGIKVSGDGDH